MNHTPIDASRDATPIRLFKSDFLEFFTHISPVTIVAVWLPVALWLLVVAAAGAHTDGSAMYVPGGFLIGLFAWTLAEYTLHGIHHAQPQVKTRLVMPLPVSIPMALLFYGLFSLVLGTILKSPEWVAPLMSGFLIGYIGYDLTHYATHHFAMRSGYAKYIKRHHMQHHYKDPDTRFGVSSPLWDWVFGTPGV
jgi:sterol desaturase/sphingolipid hydroxylase (fatty acid hydroxylase superfamily)